MPCDIINFDRMLRKYKTAPREQKTYSLLRKYRTVENKWTENTYPGVWASHFVQSIHPPPWNCCIAVKYVAQLWNSIKKTKHTGSCVKSSPVCGNIYISDDSVREANPYTPSHRRRVPWVLGMSRLSSCGFYIYSFGAFVCFCGVRSVCGACSVHVFFYSAVCARFLFLLRGRDSAPMGCLCFSVL